MERQISSISKELHQASLSTEQKDLQSIGLPRSPPSTSPPESIKDTLNMILAPPEGSVTRPISSQSRLLLKKQDNLPVNNNNTTSARIHSSQSYDESSSPILDSNSIEHILSISGDSAEKQSDDLIETPTSNSSSRDLVSSDPSPGSTSSRGLVSRRGGRVGSTGSPSSRSGAFRLVAPSQGKTPQRESSQKKTINITGKPKVTPGSARKHSKRSIPYESVPSLCSATSGSLQTYSSSSSCSPHSPTKARIMELTSSNATQNKQQKTYSPLHMNPQFDASAMVNPVEEDKSQHPLSMKHKSQSIAESDNRQSTKIEQKSDKHKPYSITVDTSCATSPLHHDLKDVKKETGSQNKNVTSDNSNKHQSSSDIHMSPRRTHSSNDDIKNSRSRLSYSPPPTGESMNQHNDPKQTPNFGLLNFHDPKLNSPSGLFLSPYSPLGMIGDAPSFERITPRLQNNNQVNDRPNGLRQSSISGGSKSTHDRSILTAPIHSNPTTPRRSPMPLNPAFSWLTSPSRGFFSPNISESGRGVIASITTPTFPSIFFQESKGLSPGDVGGTGSTSQNEEKNGNAKIRDIQRHHPYSKMICISPLASSKKQRCKSTGDLPTFSLNIDDKAKRKLETYDDLLNVPLSSPTMHVMDMHVAEKDIMEDEDLSMLLHLASSSNAGQRSPGLKKFSSRSRTGNPAPSSLQLPLMGGSEASNPDSRFPPKLDRMPFRKTSTSKQVIRSMSNEFTPPALSMRPTKSREMTSNAVKTKGNDGENLSCVNNTEQSGKSKNKSMKRSVTTMVKKNTKGSNMHNSGSDTLKSNSRNQNNSIMHPGPQAPPPYMPQNPMPVPSGGYQYPPHPGRMHHPPPGGHGYHDGMSHSGPPPMGDRRPMQHHMPPNGYPPNHNPHMRPHSVSSGQMPGNIGPGPYHYSHPPQPPMQGSGQYAPYTSINQSHTKSKMPIKKCSGYGPNAHTPGNMKQKTKKGKSNSSSGIKRHSSDNSSSGKKKARTPAKSKKNSALSKLKACKIDPNDKNSQAAALAAAILRGVTMRPSGKWQAQLYYAGKSRYIGVFDTREKAALAYEIAREKLKSDKSPDVNNQCIEDTEAAVSLARKAAFEGVNEPDPRPAHKR